MPEASVKENGDLVNREDDIGSADQILPFDLEAHPSPKEFGSNSPLESVTSSESAAMIRQLVTAPP